MLTWFLGLTDSEHVASITTSVSPSARWRGSSGNFGRLKAQRVRALVKNTFQMKQDISEKGEKPFVKARSFGKSAISLPKLEPVVRKPKENATRHRGRVPGASQSQEVSDTTQVIGTVDDFDHSDITPKDGFGPRLDNLNTSDKPFRAEIKSSVPAISGPRGSGSNLRGWGRGASIQNFKSEDLLKRMRKFSTDGDFFSKRTFGQLGCSEFMIESLRGLHFLRPSHIQVLTTS